jgi:hypothetical protein
MADLSVLQPPITFCVRESWDTGSEETFVDTLESAIEERNERVAKLSRNVPMSNKQATKYVAIYAMVRMDV